MKFNLLKNKEIPEGRDVLLTDGVIVAVGFKGRKHIEIYSSSYGTSNEYDNLVINHIVGWSEMPRVKLIQ